MNLDTATTGFLQDQRSIFTQRTYAMGLRRFLEWASVKRLEDLDINRATDFARAMKTEGLSPRSITSYLSSLVQFVYWLRKKAREEDREPPISAEDFDWLRTQVKDWNSNNKTRKLSRLPREKAVQETVQAVRVDDADNQRLRLVNLRNAALVAMWISTGCRISETAAMKRDDLEGNMTAWVRKGKGDKDRLVVFTDEQAWDTLQMYLAERDKLGYVVNGDEPLFARHDKAAHSKGEILPISTSGMRAALYDIQEKAEIEHFTPHQLRHRGATQMLNEGVNMAMVQRWLGHENINTTIKIYTHLSNESLIEAVRKGG